VQPFVAVEMVGAHEPNGANRSQRSRGRGSKTRREVVRHRFRERVRCVGSERGLRRDAGGG
jgi:hypothetical protein